MMIIDILKLLYHICSQQTESINLNTKNNKEADKDTNTKEHHEYVKMFIFLINTWMALTVF